MNKPNNQTISATNGSKIENSNMIGHQDVKNSPAANQNTSMDLKLEIEKLKIEARKEGIRSGIFASLIATSIFEFIRWIITK